MMPQFIAAVDIGTSKVTCHIVDQNASIIGKSTIKVHVVFVYRRHVYISTMI